MPIKRYTVLSFAASLLALTATYAFAGNSEGYTSESQARADGCLIKGNISQKTGEKIYHMPGDAYYEATVISPEYGERWFCSAADAERKGWRRTKR